MRVYLYCLVNKKSRLHYLLPVLIEIKQRDIICEKKSYLEVKLLF